MGLLAFSFLAVGVWLMVANSRNPVTKVMVEPRAIFEHYGLAFFFLAVGVGIPLLNNISTIQLGNIKGEQDVALFSAASKLVNLILIALVSANLLIAPKLSPLFEAGKKEEMLSLIRKNNGLIAILTIPPTFVLVFFAESVLGIFGAEYADASPLLRALAIGQIVSVACGPVVLTSTLIGKQKQTAITVFLLCAVNLLLCKLLIPHYGPMGAVIASASIAILLNVILAITIWVTEGLNVTMLNLVWK